MVEHLMNFQTLIAGALVLLGVVVTLYFNAWLARKNRREDLKSEKTIVRTALIEELKVIRRALADGIEKIEEAGDEAASLAVPKHPLLDVYNTCLPKIGLLSPVQAENVLCAYLSVVQHHRNLMLFPGAKDFDEHRVELPSASFQAFSTAHRNLLKDVNKAILCLKDEDMAAS